VYSFWIAPLDKTQKPPNKSVPPQFVVSVKLHPSAEDENPSLTNYLHCGTPEYKYGPLI